jgi:hypothetical protein
MTSRLAAPGKPWPRLGKDFWSAVAISAGVGFVINIFSSPIAGAIGAAFLGGVVFYIVNLARNWTSLQKTWQVHQGRIFQYYESYYCKRDDVCFMPGVYSAQPEQYKAWLFQYN